MTIETANRLYELRKKHNLSQEELAEKLGVSRQAVSKWERSEASPDTDNLISLAKIYDLSLDELIFGEKESNEENKEENREASTHENSEESKDENLFVDIDDGKDKVKIDANGIVVESEEGETVTISWKGIKIETNKKDDDEDNDDDDDDYDDDEDDSEDSDENAKIYKTGDGKVTIKLKNDLPKPNTAKFWLSVPYPIICAIVYLWFGFSNIYGGFGLSWIIFVTIPLYYSLVKAISKRKLRAFNYSVLMACVYLYFGLYQGNWHPSWLVFLTIPVYYPIASIIDSGIKRVK